MASSSRSHSRAGSVTKTLPAPLITAGTSTASSASRTRAAFLFVRTSTAMCPGQTRSAPSIRASALKSETMSAATSYATCSRAESTWAQPPRVNLPLARGTTRTRSGAGSGAPLNRGARFPGAALPLPVDNALVAELRVAEQRVVGVEQPLVAAPVGPQRRLGARRPRRLDVGVDVGAAERVDRLLRVADQHQRDVPVPERGSHDLP